MKKQQEQIARKLYSKVQIYEQWIVYTNQLKNTHNLLVISLLFQFHKSIFALLVIGFLVYLFYLSMNNSFIYIFTPFALQFQQLKNFYINQQSTECKNADANDSHFMSLKLQFSISLGRSVENLKSQLISHYLETKSTHIAAQSIYSIIEISSTIKSQAVFRT
ncbi:hypothetical protein SS50377_25896 [Spironucleus salmonicida]|uniref:Transmembrane protein n=1 Tax=Spironucleus salmonicida TaxID=348837 RepID=V6LSV0_9EUKA|nr:hypothetical protein SS50377_25894 [Spironucleus salmonicida]KAH0571705.1 hypothetical protein SS50377_25896 [Spironucleus salmonicida]|eukprot:EST47333.1 Hypothetical protein SS50377_12605 [Spironucleus salmonicida]